MEDDNLSLQQFKSLLDETLRILQIPETNIRAEEYDILESAIRSIHFFQLYLEAPANLHDFSQLMKYHLRYEVHPRGVALMKEGEYCNNFYVVLKGNAQKLQPRSYKEIEMELKHQAPEVRQKDKRRMAKIQAEIMNQPAQKELPRYLQHTKTTKKKYVGTKAEQHLAMLNKILQETELKFKKVSPGSRLKSPMKTSETNTERGSPPFLRLNLASGPASPSKTSGNNSKDAISLSKQGSPSTLSPIKISDQLKKEGDDDQIKEEMDKGFHLDGDEEKDEEEEKEEEEKREDDKKDEEKQSENTEKILEEENEGEVEVEVEKQKAIAQEKENIQKEKSKEKSSKNASPLSSISKDKSPKKETKSEKSKSPVGKEKKKSNVNSKEGSPKQTKRVKNNNKEEEKKEENEEKKNEEKESEEDAEDEEISENNEENQKRDKKPLHSMSNDEVKFIKEVAAKNAEIQNRCFLGEILRVKTDKIYNVGDYFGENFYRRSRVKEGSIIAVLSEEVHLLVITREAYELVMGEIEEKSQEKAKFFMDLFPFFDPLVIKKFSYNFSEKEFKKNETIYSQDQPVQDLYILKSGDVRLFKEIDASPDELEHSSSRSYLLNSKISGRVGLPITVVMKHQFFGDEVFLKQEKRRYTAVPIAANASTYFLKMKVYNQIKGFFADLVQILGKQTREKFAWRDQRAVELLQRRQESMKAASRSQATKEIMMNSKLALRYQLGIRWGQDPPLKPRSSNLAKWGTQTKEGFRDRANASDLESSIGQLSLLKTIDYSREAKIADKLVDGTYMKKMVEKSMREGNRSNVMDSFVEFNVMKELQYKPTIRTRPPKSQTRDFGIGRSARTDRNGRSPESDTELSPEVKRLVLRLGTLASRDGSFSRRNDESEDRIDRKLREVIHHSHAQPFISSSIISELSLEGTHKLEGGKDHVLDCAKTVRFVKHRSASQSQLKSIGQLSMETLEKRQEKKNIKFSLVMGKKMRFIIKSNKQ